MLRYAEHIVRVLEPPARVPPALPCACVRSLCAAVG
jgi:hypothetical protein